MNFLIDAIIVIIAAACCIWGFKSGFVKMIVSFLKNIIAIIIASVFASKLGAYLYENVFKSVFESLTVDKISKWLGTSTDGAPDIGPLLDTENSEFLSFIDKLGFDFGSISEKYAEFGESAEEAMIEYISRPLGVTVSNVVAFILIFIASVLIIKLIGFIIDKIVKLPVLNVTNRLLGLVLGAVLGVIFIFVFTGIVDAILPLIKINDEHIVVGAVEEGTILYKYFVNRTPAGMINDILSKIGVNK